MLVAKNIQTGVDRLVKLLHEQHKISLDDAAKTLAVPKLLVQEWSSLLEEEGVLDVKYSFSKTFLYEKGLSDQEREQKELEMSTERETFIVRAQTIAEEVRSETTSFEQFRTYYDAQRESLHHEVDTLLKAVDTIPDLQGEDALLAEKDRIVASHTLINQHQKDVESAIVRLHTRYKEVVTSFEAFEAALVTHRQHMHDTVTFSTDIATAFRECAKALDGMRADIVELKAAALHQGPQAVLTPPLVPPLHQSK